MDEDWDDLDFEIYAGSEDELMDQLLDIDTDNLETLLRCVNRVYQHKALGSSLVGSFKRTKRREQRKVDKPLKPITSPCARDSVTLGKYHDDSLFVIDDIIPNRPYDPTWDEPKGWVDLEVTLPPSTPYYQQLLWYKGSTTMSSNNYVSILDCCVNTQATTTCTPINPSWGPGVPKAWSNPINKECTPMLTETEKKTNYLSSRLENILYTTSDNLVEKFNINEVKPKNTKQAKEWLAAGGLTVTGDDETRYFNVVWNDPAKPRDDAGYKAAYSALHTSYQNAIDTIRIAEPKDGLEALKAFETANLLPN